MAFRVIFTNGNDKVKIKFTTLLKLKLQLAALYFSVSTSFNYLFQE